ncbi:MAG TPA: SpaA isopeptide-forming pilin-related protein [Bacillota bacterium]
MKLRKKLVSIGMIFTLCMLVLNAFNIKIVEAAQSAPKYKTFMSEDRGNVLGKDGKTKAIAWIDRRTALNPDGGALIGTRYKTDENNILTYCLNYDLDSPKLTGNEYVQSEEKITNKEYSALVYGYGGDQDITQGKLGLTDANDRYYVTQVGLYVVSEDYNSGDITLDTIVEYTRNLPGHESITPEKTKQMVKDIRSFVNHIENNPLEVPEVEDISVKIEGDASTMEDKGSYLESNELKVISDNSNGTLSIDSTGLGEAYVVNANGEKVDDTYVLEGHPFKLRLDAKDATTSGEVQLSITGEVQYQDVHKYVPRYDESDPRGQGVTGEKLQRIVWIGNDKNSSSDSITIPYEAVQRTIEVTKTDENGELLDGAVFELQSKEGKVIKEAKTTENGKVVFNDVPLGIYDIVEVEAPEGYVKNDNPVEVNVTGNESDPIEVKIENKIISGSLLITKTDVVNDEPLPNTTFQIKDEEGNVIREGKTDEEGVALFEEIPYGKYTYQEIEAPEGYVIDKNPYPFEIKVDGEVIKAEMDNKLIEGSLVLIKKDAETGEPLEGAKFQVIDEEGNIIDGETDENGRVVFEELTYGKYTYVETKAPKGYQLDASKQTFEINKDGQEIKIEVTNEKEKAEEVPVDEEKEQPKNDSPKTEEKEEQSKNDSPKIEEKEEQPVPVKSEKEEKEIAKAPSPESVPGRTKAEERPDQTKPNDLNDGGERLPKTSTNMYNLGLLGGLLVLFGIVSLVYLRKRRDVTDE